MRIRQRGMGQNSGPSHQSAVPKTYRDAWTDGSGSGRAGFIRTSGTEGVGKRTSGG